MNTELYEPVAVSRGLPTGLVLVEAAAASFAAWLESRGCGDWQIFQSPIDLDDFAKHAPEPGPAEWSPLEPLSGHAGAVHRLLEIRDAFTLYPSGACVLDPHPVALARWFYVSPGDGSYRSLQLVAAPDESAVAQLNAVVRERMHDGTQSTWQILRGSYVEKETTPRDASAGDGIFLAPEIQARVDRDLVGFFRPDVAAMYRTMGVPHRRGALLYGPPGNGKTSLIRALGGRLPQVTALILRASASFDSDDLEFAIDLWTKQAPAMLVIEDLNWLMERINVSTFLNLLDGIDTPAAPGGLLLLASTNHPDKLDTALSNRPGRFDVIIELPAPADAQRRLYLERHAPTVAADALVGLIEASEGLSFAHLGEVIRLAGLLALHEGREARGEADYVQAVETVQAARREADDGFRGPPPSFGLHKFVKRS